VRVAMAKPPVSMGSSTSLGFYRKEQAPYL
jgi:hypothetical protein